MLDIDESLLEPLSNQQLPVPVDPIAGSFNVDLALQQDKLANPSSILVQLIIGVNKRNESGNSVILVDGIFPTCGFYPFRTVSVKVNQNYLFNDIQAKSDDFSLLRIKNIKSI